MFSSLFGSVTSEEKTKAIEELITHSSPNYGFFLMVALSVSMAAFGAVLDDSVILIGSMLIAPVLYPILSLALGLVLAENPLIIRSSYTIFKSFLYAIVAGFIIGTLFGIRGDFVPEAIQIIAFEKPSLAYTVVAAISGIAASFAVVKPSLSETLPGVAISVSLVPPLAVVGIGFSLFDLGIIINSFLLFLVNVCGVVFSAMIVFSLFQLSRKRTVAEEVIKEEDKKIEEEKTAR